MEEYNGIQVGIVDGSGILIVTPVNEFIFSKSELNFISTASKTLLDKSNRKC